MPSNESFHIGDLLSVTTGVLVSPDHMQGVYRLVDYVTGHAHWTHQLPRASKEVTPVLLEQHPWLADIVMPEFGDEADVHRFLARVGWRYGTYHEVTPMAAGTYVAQDPIAELRQMAPQAEVIGVVVDEGTGT